MANCLQWGILNGLSTPLLAVFQHKTSVSLCTCNVTREYDVTTFLDLRV